MVKVPDHCFQCMGSQHKRPLPPHPPNKGLGAVKVTVGLTVWQKSGVSTSCHEVALCLSKCPALVSARDRTDSLSSPQWGSEATHQQDRAWHWSTIVDSHTLPLWGWRGLVLGALLALPSPREESGLCIPCPTPGPPALLVFPW